MRWLKHPALAIGTAIAWIALSAYYPDAAMLVIGVPLTIYGFVGLARLRIVAQGRRGPPQTYVGSHAVAVSLFSILVGGFVSAFAFYQLWPSFSQALGR
jgi:hypothetical protein